MNLGRIEIDGKSRKVIFHGECLEMLDICHAACCRDWDVGISAKEFHSGHYLAKALCRLTAKECLSLQINCRHRTYRLDKHPDGRCIYLENDLCSIYENRPQVCRDFQCQSGWRLVSVFPHKRVSADLTPKKLDCDLFLEKIKDDAVFVLHPLIKLHALFYLPTRQEIIFIKEIVGGCGKFNTREALNCPQLDEAKLQLLIDLFNRKESLGQLYNRFCAESKSELTRNEFLTVVWLLNKHQIVLDSINFQGMLSGQGRID
ncbi:YkgJ family cysteine cluster protein [candidate division KSB1 bacterium]|nr:YkgJ family cysteine cluster protein [candidate division KSB1 bacterium]